MIGRYRVLDFLGSGAMGEVFLAEDPQIERRLAIKTVRLAGRPQEIEDRKRRLLREARAAGRLLHPNVVTLFDAGEADGMLYLAFELVEGTDLAGRLETGPTLSLREVLRIIRQVADALDFAHRQGIVHRDIKPSNILLDKQGRVKVADFGIAKVTGQSTELTVAGSVMGSPQYLSPEQIRGEDLDGRSDIFSLGVVLYELLSQKRPFDGDTITTLVYQILHKEPPPISELRAVPDRLEALLRRMLAKNRDERFATAADLSAEVAACERELSDETLSAPASNLPMQATRILPKRTTDAVPEAAGAAGAASAAEVQPAAAQLPPRVPTPPPIPARAAAPAVSAASVASASRPGYGKGLAIAILLVLFLLMAAAGAGVWWFFFHRPAQVAEGNGLGIPPGQETPSSPPVSSTSATPGPSAATTAAAVPAGSVSPAPREATPPPAVPEPAQSPVPVPPRAGSRTGQPAQTTAQAAPPIATAPGGPRQRGPFVPPSAGSSGSVEPQRPPVPAPSSRTMAPEPEAPAGRSEPEEEERPARSNDGPVDLTLKTGLALVFRPDPPDAFVLVDGTSIGRATEWNGQKGGRTFTLSGPGEHRIKIRSQGMKDFKILVQASETGGVTPILSRLKPLPAAQADASDLKVYRVREAVAFKVDPPGATILVDGQPAGQVKSFGGGRFAPSTWLKLPPGRHRIGLVASGMARQDFVVEVFEGADKDREKIEATLQPGG
jgi:eukaryotic-like serine/threonine-protein kinase